MTPRQVIAAALRTNEYKLLEMNGWRLASTERQLNNGTLALKHKLFPHKVVITTLGRVRANNFAYGYMNYGTDNDKLRDGMQRLIDRTYFGTWK